MAQKVILLGASGLIGRFLLSEMLKDNQYDEIIIFVRKQLPLKDLRLQQIITDLEDLNSLKDQIIADAIFCCLGSTKSKTPDLKKYNKIDHDIPLFFAQQGLKNGANQFHIVTALGANSKSSNFYTKMKGEVEEDIKKVGYPSLFIYQPSFLTGDRQESRPLEKIMTSIMSFLNIILIGPLKKYKSIAAEDVAKAMYNESIKNKKGIFVHESDKIKELA